MKRSNDVWTILCVLFVFGILPIGLLVLQGYLQKDVPIKHEGPSNILPDSVTKDGILHQPQEFVFVRSNRVIPIDCCYRKSGKWGISCSCGFIHPLEEYSPSHMLIGSMICSCGYCHPLYVENGQLKVHIDTSY